MKTRYESPIVVLASRLLIPFIQLFALYVVFHGHYSPGGGFQGGTILAASVILMRLAVGEGAGELQFRKRWSSKLSATGVMIFAFTGVVTFLLGGKYLDYRYLPFPFLTQAETRAMGILIVEIGVAICVVATMISIYDDLLEEHAND